MSSRFWLLRVESRDFSQVEKEGTACKAEQIHKMTTIFTQNDNQGPFWVKIVVIFLIYSALQAVSAWDKPRDLGANSQKVEDILTTSVEINHAGEIFEGTRQDISGVFHLHLF